MVVGMETEKMTGKKTVRERAQEAYGRVREEALAPESPGAGDSFRVGGKVARNLYWVSDRHPEGVDVGRIDFSTELAAWIVEAANNKIRGMVGAGEVYLNEIIADRNRLKRELEHARAEVCRLQQVIDQSESLAEVEVRRLRAELGAARDALTNAGWRKTAKPGCICPVAGVMVRPDCGPCNEPYVPVGGTDE